MNRRRIFIWELWGFVIITLVGSAMHFVFAWSGYWRPIAWLVAVNESTWEHLKLAFWPGFFLALLEYLSIKSLVNNFWIAKSLGLFSMLVFIVVVFYGYSAILGQNYLVADISLFVLAVMFGQLVSYRLMIAKQLGMKAKLLPIIGLVIMLAAFAIFSYFTPQMFLFEDTRIGQYGILDQ